jgi:hypothetical protein
VEEWEAREVKKNKYDGFWAQASSAMPLSLAQFSHVTPTITLAAFVLYLDECPCLGKCLLYIQPPCQSTASNEVAFKIRDPGYGNKAHGKESSMWHTATHAKYYTIHSTLHNTIVAWSSSLSSSTRCCQ